MSAVVAYKFNRRDSDWENLEAALEDLANAKKAFYESIKEMEQAKDRCREIQANIQKLKEALCLWNEDI